MRLGIDHPGLLLDFDLYTTFKDDNKNMSTVHHVYKNMNDFSNILREFNFTEMR